jgi:glycosyltransferase involved in cell wall biosynthesis
MSVYNERPEFLERAFESIRDQDLRDFEVLLIDDGSDRPETLAVLERCAESDDRVRLMRNAHCGLTESLSRGLRECRAALICRHDSDDWSEPARFASQAEFLRQRQDCALVGSQAWLHQENGAPLWMTDLPLEPAAALKAFEFCNPFVHGAAMFRTEAALAVGGYRREFLCSQDYDFFWRLCERFGGANLPEPYYHHRKTANAISTQRSVEQAHTVQVTRLLARMRAKGEADDIGVARLELARPAGPLDASRAVLFRNADGLLLAGHYRRALGAYIEGILKAPFSAVGYLKLVRWGGFILFPMLRKHLFA